MLRTALLLSLLTLSARAGEPSYAPPPPPRDPSTLGLNIQRTMRLLATSTPAHHNRVRILFYGQSITEQSWSKAVADDLRKRFPNADLEIENRAIGGFSSQSLIRPAEHDLYPFYPDLLIFHVYGANQQYEEIIRNVRTRTTAEVLMQRDHLTKWPPGQIDRDKDKSAWWDNLMNEKFLPDIAKKYGCGLADVRSGWIDYLNANHLEPKDLLRDGVHLNDHGNYLMAELIKQNLVYRPDLPTDPWKDLVKTVEIGKDVRWTGHKLTLEFEGNRLDALALARATEEPGRVAPTPAVKVLIDGKRPSDFPEACRITRPTPAPWSPLFISRVDHDKPLLLEDWTLKVTAVSPDAKSFKYALHGSLTGDDGAGASDRPFTSPSGRVHLDPASFFRGRNDPLPVGYECHWKVLPLFTDTFESPQATDPTHEYPTTLIQGIPNTRHALELTFEGPTPPPISALRAYRPPAR